MQARKKLKVSLAILGGLAAVLLLAAGALHLMFPGSHINRIRKSSPIYPQAMSFAPEWEQRVRDTVLQQLPIGSTRQQIQAFLQQHFIHIQYRIARLDDERALTHVDEPHVFIRAIDDTGFPGECRVEIYLLLSADERLKDVVVKCMEIYV
jgi:hypothetical protein